MYPIKWMDSGMLWLWQGQADTSVRPPAKLPGDILGQNRMFRVPYQCSFGPENHLLHNPNPNSV